MKTEAKLKPIYSDDYYRTAKLVKSRRFQSRLRAARKAWAACGIPIPASGFARAKDYYAWTDKLRAACNASMKSKEAADAVEKVHNDTSLSATEKVWRRLEVQDSFLPPLPQGVVDTLLEESGLDSKNEEYRRFLTKHIFFHQQEFSEPFFHIVWKRNEKTDQMDLFLKIEPHTKREHIMAFWDRIAEQQKRIPGYRGKNKEWKTFDRDLHIYSVYQEVKSSMADKRASNESGRRRLDEIVWSRLNKEDSKTFKNMSFEQIRKSVSRIAALDKPVTVKEMD